MSKNILISALGANHEIIEETIAYTNYNNTLDFYKDHNTYEEISKSRAKAEFSTYQADELWLVATDKKAVKTREGKYINSTYEDFYAIKEACSRYVSKIRLFVLDGVNDIVSEDEALQYRDLAFRVIRHAKHECDGGKLYLSLACGRKTMSADFQEAAYCFGCDALIHVLGNGKTDAHPLNLGRIPQNEVLRDICDEGFADTEILRYEPNTDFLKLINKKKKESQHFFTAYYLNENETRSNFHILYTLPPSKIEALKNEYLGTDKAKKETELEYLRRLPKTDLHCHLGGVLSVSEMIEVARCYVPLIEQEKNVNEEFAAWKCSYVPSVPLKKWYGELSDKLRVHKGLIAASLILQYEDNPEELHKLIFGKYTEESIYRQIEITNYEKLGDLQGSALLCNEDAIRKTVQILLRNCKKENVAYIEIRCSPINYKTENLLPRQVMTAIFEELEKVPEIEASVLIIASRHGKREFILQSIELMNEMKGEELFDKYFRGFDLAGNEESARPIELRNVFLDVMKDCNNITIHAGETDTSESIWEAVYHLNAERIGHGLRLIDNQYLMTKFLDRGIGIEMCPSSNFQIVGFKDNYYTEETKTLQEYPLKHYLEKELKVSVNTDNSGISITTPTNELHRAARMTPGGLSKWDLLQLICNGFRTAFYPYEKKKTLIRKVERMIDVLIKKDLL